MIKAYRLITTAGDLKRLHDEADLNGVREVGVSRGRILYAWDEERNNLRSITPEEAADRLGLTLKQIDKIVETLGEVEFETIEEQPIIEDIETYEVEAVEVYQEAPEEVIEAPVVEEEQPQLDAAPEVDESYTHVNKEDLKEILEVLEYGVRQIKYLIEN